jgi:hypothetical protein
MLPIPMPEKSGSIEALAPLLNLANRNDLVLVVAWLLATFRSGGYQASKGRQRPSFQSCSEH